MTLIKIAPLNTMFLCIADTRRKKRAQMKMVWLANEDSNEKVVRNMIVQFDDL